MAKRAKFRILAEAEVPLDKLHEDPENANLHDEENLAALAASLKRFKQPERLIVRKSDGLVWAGNGRLEALRRLGWKTARVQYIEGSNAECRAYAIAANQTPRMSRFDFDVLVPQLEDLQEHGGLEGTGYDKEGLDALLEELEPPTKENPGGTDGSSAKLTVTCPKCSHEFKVGGK